MRALNKNIVAPWLLLLLALSVGNAFTTPNRRATAITSMSELRLQNTAGNNDEFWQQQQELAKEMSDASDKSIRDEQANKYQERLMGLVSDTAFYSVLIFCILWVVSPNPFTGISFAFGATFGTAYSYGLGKYVETIGGSAMDTETVQGAGVGQARFAFLILLFVIVGKFRTQGLQEIPAIAGFFTYQIASLSQGLREFND